MRTKTNHICIFFNRFFWNFLIIKKEANDASKKARIQNKILFLPGLI